MKFTYFHVKHLMLVLTILTFTLTLVFGQTNTNHVRVSGYTRSDGTYVKPHYRTAPNSTNRDNFSTLGNINSYTGKLGWIAPDNDNYVPESGYNYSSTNISDSFVRTNTRSRGQLWEEPRQLKSIRALSKGENVNVIGYEKGFWKVIHNGTIGYIYNETIIVNAKMYPIKYPSKHNRQKSYNSFGQSIPNSLVVFEKVNMYEMEGADLLHKLLGTEKDRAIIKVHKEEGVTKIDLTIKDGTLPYTAIKIKKLRDVDDVSFFLF